MNGYNSTIKFSSRELTARERIRYKDLGKAAQLDDVVTQDQPFVIDLDFYLDLEIHNEHAKSDTKDYSKRVLVDKAGNMFVTGSESFTTAMDDIMAELGDDTEDVSLECYKVPSKNYSGKCFLSCTII